MAINFPDNPQDGEEYAASNGIVYTYNAANDSWTGALNVGSDYWSQDAGGNLYPTDTSADVWVGGDSGSLSSISMNYINLDNKALSDQMSRMEMRDFLPMKGDDGPTKFSRRRS